MSWLSYNFNMKTAISTDFSGNVASLMKYRRLPLTRELGMGQLEMKRLISYEPSQDDVEYMLHQLRDGDKGDRETLNFK